MLPTPRTASQRRAGLAFAIPVSFTAGEELWWSQRASWIHPEAPPYQGGTEGDDCMQSLAAGEIGLSGAVSEKQLSFFSVLTLKAACR